MIALTACSLDIVGQASSSDGAVEVGDGSTITLPDGIVTPTEKTDTGL